MRKIASTDNANVLQVAGSSLDIGAKVYGLRVDDVHAKGLQLASSMAKSNEKQINEENGEFICLLCALFLMIFFRRGWEHISRSTTKKEKCKEKDKKAGS
jgi:hypothetical protein